MHFAVIPLVFLSFSVWFLRLVNESIHFSERWVEELWLIFLRPGALLLSGVAFVSLFLRVLKTYSTRKFWLWSFIAAAVFCIPYVPDMYASFVRAGEKRALLLSIAFYLLGILTYGLIRGLACLVCTKWTLLRAKSLLSQSIILYFFLLIGEYFFFHTWHPITYFPSLPLPLPAARFVSKSERQDEKLKYLLIETQMSGEVRQQISQGGVVALSILGDKLAREVKTQIGSLTMSSSVVVLLPETFVSLDDIENNYSLLEPLVRTLFEESLVDRVVWVQGAFVKNNNVIIGTEVRKNDIQERSQSIKWEPIRVIRRKNEQMPMFEAPSKGVSYSAIQNDGRLAEETIAQSQSELKRFVESHHLMICYESLFPANWSFQKPTVIFTNHHLFNEFHLMNWVYVGFLRQLSFLFASPVKVVSNSSSSGMLSPASAQRRDDSWAVVKFH